MKLTPKQRKRARKVANRVGRKTKPRRDYSHVRGDHHDGMSIYVDALFGVRPGRIDESAVV